MKVAKWIYLGVPVLAGVGILLATQPKGSQWTPPSKIEFTDRAEGIIGRPLTSAESTTVADAIDSIGTPPPAAVVCTVNTKRCTLKCADIADTLRRQLRRPGGIEAETGPRKRRARATTKADSLESTEGDEINISEDFLRNARTDPDKLKYLQAILLHEFCHKKQTKATMGNPALAEKEAFGIALAYKDSIGMEWTDTDYWEEMKAHQHFSSRVEGGTDRLHYLCPALAHECLILYDSTEGLVGDSLISFELGDLSYYSYPFGPTRASDMMIFENYFMLPDSHCLALVCGGVPFMNLARLLLLDLYDGEVVASLDTLDFPGMFFYSMTYSYETGLYYFLDTLNQQIVAMADTDADSVPETMASVYANAFEPGFDPLLDMRGVDAGAHPYRGAGISVNHFDIHLGELIYPYDSLFFLPDYDGNNMADACLSVPRYEFLIFTPVIQVPFPWVGENTVMLHATWQHDIEVWTSDSSGQTLYEMLGVIPMMDGIDAECMLSRPLMAGEFIVPIDGDLGGQHGLAIQVIDPTPQNVTIQLFDSEAEIFILRWEEVSGADHYNIYESDDPMVFPLEPTYGSMTNDLHVLAPIGERLFYRVTAER